MHGFRSTFRTWAEECTHFQHAVIETSMAHKVGSETERRLPAWRAAREAPLVEGRLGRVLREAIRREGDNVVPMHVA